MFTIQGVYQQNSTYVIQNQIGSGANSNVYSGTWYQPNGFEIKVAIKLIEMKTNSGRDNTYYLKEKEITQQILEAQLSYKKENRNLIGIIEIFDIIQVGSTTYIISELSFLGDLYTLFFENFQTQPFETVLRIAYQIIKGLEFLHALNITHRDIKPENFILTQEMNQQWEVKIIDFGVSSPNEQMISKVGTVYYLAPELISMEDYTNKVDIWSYGCILHELISGQPLFQGNTQMEIVKQIRLFSGEYPYYQNFQDYMPLLHVIQQCIHVNPLQRLKSFEISQILEQIAQENNIFLNNRDINFPQNNEQQPSASPLSSNDYQTKQSFQSHQEKLPSPPSTIQQFNLVSQGNSFRSQPKINTGTQNFSPLQFEVSNQKQSNRPSIHNQNFLNKPLLSNDNINNGEIQKEQCASILFQEIKDQNYFTFFKTYQEQLNTTSLGLPAYSGDFQFANNNKQNIPNKIKLLYLIHLISLGHLHLLNDVLRIAKDKLQNEQYGVLTYILYQICVGVENNSNSASLLEVCKKVEVKATLTIMAQNNHICEIYLSDEQLGKSSQDLVSLFPSWLRYYIGCLWLF